MGNIHMESVPTSESLTGSIPSEAVSKAVDKTNSMIKNGTNQSINEMDNVVDAFKSLIKNTGSTVTDFGKETSKSLEEVAQAGGRATLALGYLCSKLFDGLSATVATSSGYLASGVRSINDIIGDWPVVGVVSGSLNAVTTQVANTLGEISTNGRKSRQKMFESLRGQLNQSGGRLSNAQNSVTDVSTGTSSGNGMSDTV